MVRTTRPQRQALLRVFKRHPLRHGTCGRNMPQATDPDTFAMPYRQFRALVQPTFGCDGAVVVPWCGMWLCIERDGYTHS